jgi:uncharacterized membrane-anchored protein
MKQHWLGVASAALLTTTVSAQDVDDSALSSEEQEALAAMTEFWDSLDRRTGTIPLGDDLVTLELPGDFYFLGTDDATRVLVDVWGNPPDQSDGLLGMLFPEKYTPFDAEAWAVTVEYVEEGHVSDSDAAEIDYDGLLVDMQQDIRAGNDDRVAAGYDSIELVGWAEAPHYDAGSHKLYWAKELRFGESPSTTLNYEIRALGRKGVLSMTFVAATEQLGEINASREDVLSMASFNPGMRYEDFDSNIDEIAAYGIGALIAGKVAAKAGLFAAGLVLLKKFGIFVVVALAALARKAKGLLGRAPA